MTECVIPLAPSRLLAAVRARRGARILHAIDTTMELNAFDARSGNLFNDSVDFSGTEYFENLSEDGETCQEMTMYLREPPDGDPPTEMPPTEVRDTPEKVAWARPATPQSLTSSRNSTVTILTVTCEPLNNSNEPTGMSMQMSDIITPQMTQEFSEISPQRNEILSDVTQEFPELLPELTDLTQDLPDNSPQMADMTQEYSEISPQIAQEFSEISPQVTQDFTAISPQIAQEFSEISPQIAEEFSEISPQVAQDFTEISPQMAQEFPEISTQMTQDFTEISPKMAQEFPENSPQMTQVFTEISPQMAQEFPEIPPQMTQEFTEISPQITQTFIEISPQIADTPNKFTEISSQMISLPSQMTNVTQQFTEITQRFTEISPQLTEISPQVISLQSQITDQTPQFTEVSPQSIDISPQVITLPSHTAEMTQQFTEISSQSITILPGVIIVPSQMAAMTPHIDENSPQSIKLSPQVITLPTKTTDKTSRLAEMSPQITGLSPLMTDMSLQMAEMSPEMTDMEPELTEKSIQMPNKSQQTKPRKVAKKIIVNNMSLQKTNIESQLNDDSMDIPSIEPQITDDSEEMPDLSVQIPDLSLQLNGRQTPGIPLKKIARKIVVLPVKPRKLMGPPLKVAKKIIVPDMSLKVTNIESQFNDDSMDIPSIEPQITDDSEEMPDLSVEIPDLSLQLGGPQTPGIPSKKMASQKVELPVKPRKLLGPPLKVAKKIKVPDMSQKVSNIELQLTDDSMDIPSIESQIIDDSEEMPDLSVQIPDLSLQLGGPQTPGIPSKKITSQIVVPPVKPRKLLGPPLKVAKKIKVSDMSLKVSNIEPQLDDDSMDIPSIGPQITDDSEEMPDLSVEIPDLSLQLNGPQTPGIPSKKAASQIVVQPMKPRNLLGPPLKVAKKIRVPDMSLKESNIELQLNDDSMDIPSIEPQITDDSEEMPDLSVQMPDLSLQLGGPQTPGIPSKKITSQIVVLPVAPRKMLRPPLVLAKKIIVPDMSQKVTDIEPQLNDDSMDIPSIEPQITDDSEEMPDLSVRIPDLSLQLNGRQTPGVPLKKIASKIVVMPVKARKLMGPPLIVANKIIVPDMSQKVTDIEPQLNDDSMDIPSIEPQITDDSTEMPDLSIQIPDLSQQLNGRQTPGVPLKKIASKVVVMPVKARKLMGPPLIIANKIIVPDMSQKVTNIESQLNDDSMDIPSIEPQITDDSMEITDLSVQIPDIPLQLNGPQPPQKIAPSKKTASKIVLPVEQRKLPGLPLKDSKKITVPDMSLKVTNIEPPFNDDSMDIPSIEPQLNDDAEEMPDLSVEIPDLSLQLNEPQTPGAQSNKAVVLPVKSRKLRGITLKDAKEISEALSIESQLIHHCDFPGCEKAFAKTSHLVVHKNAHSGEKPYLCWWDNCDWRFSRADELSRHVRCKHSVEKRFQCSRCDACFTRSDHLAKHSRKHEKGWGGPIKLAPRKPRKK